MPDQGTAANEIHLAESPAERFYSGAQNRIKRFMMILGIVGTVVCLGAWGKVPAAGFALGALISYVNHVWLERMIDALGERITSGESQERGGVVMFSAVLRYAVIAGG